jgi:predicted Zn-dependent protease with MMP-like domain
MHLRRSFALSAAAAALLLTACGDDDDTAADTTTTEAEAEGETTTTAATEEGGVNPEFTEYCAAVAELDQQEEFASAEQFERVREVAPDEIRDEINTAIDIIVAAIESGDPEAAFDDPALQEAFGPIEAFETENCGTPAEEATGEVNPEFADYCALAIELDEQPSFPSEEQLTEIRDAAPEEIAEEAEIVVAGFLEAIAAGTPEAAFDDPDVVENLDAIEAFDEANCGIDHTDN